MRTPSIRVLEFSQSYYYFEQCVGRTVAETDAAMRAFYSAPMPTWAPADRHEAVLADRRRVVRWNTVSDADRCPWGYGWLRVEGDRMVWYQSHWDST